MIFVCAYYTKVLEHSIIVKFLSNAWFYHFSLTVCSYKFLRLSV